MHMSSAHLADCMSRHHILCNDCRRRQRCICPQRTSCIALVRSWQQSFRRSNWSTGAIHEHFYTYPQHIPDNHREPQLRRGKVTHSALSILSSHSGRLPPTAPPTYLCPLGLSRMQCNFGWPFRRHLAHCPHISDNPRLCCLLEYARRRNCDPSLTEEDITASQCATRNQKMH